MAGICVNCKASTADVRATARIQCNSCKLDLHVACTGLSADDHSRLTRLKIKTLKILCNGCNDNFDQLTAVRESITTLKSELLDKIDLLNTKISQLETRSNSQSSIMSPKTLEEVTSEAVKRINRSKNLLIKGISESIGDVFSRKRKDTTEVMKALTVINEHVLVPASIVRLGPVPKNGDRPRYIKVTFTDLNILYPYQF